MRRRKFMTASALSGLGLALLAATGPLAGSGALAQSYPSRPITVLFPLAGGSPQETIMRAMAAVASKQLGQPVIVEPKPGAAVVPTIMAQTVKSDGYTIAGVFSTIATVPQMEKVGFDPARDFTYLMQFASFPVGIAIKADSPHKSWADVVAHAKANPGKVTFGTPGGGSFAQLAMELVLDKAGAKMTHVPYKGPMPIIQAVLTSEVMLQVSGMEWKPHVESGGMRLLGMLTAKPHPSFPNAPAISELGDLKVLLGLVGPKDLAPEIAKRLHDAFRTAADDPSVRELYKKFDIDQHYASGDDFKKSLEDIGRTMKPVIERLGLAVK